MAKGYAHINVTPSLMLNTSSSTLEVSGGWAPAKSPRRSGGVTAAGCWRRTWSPCRWDSRRAGSSGSAAWSSARWTGCVSAPSRPGPGDRQQAGETHQQQSGRSFPHLPSPISPFKTYEPFEPNSMMSSFLKNSQLREKFQIQVLEKEILSPHLLNLVSERQIFN